MLSFVSILSYYVLVVKGRNERKDMQAIYFDMDGTIADLYGVDNWLPMLHSSNVKPYEVAEPMVDMDEFRKLCQRAQSMGVIVGVISWLCKGSSMDYAKATRKAKKEWLARNTGVAFDEIHIIPHGRPKQRYVKVSNAVLVDDSPIVCGQWDKGRTLDAKRSNWLEVLSMLLDKME